MRNGNVVVPGCVRNGIDSDSANKIFDEMAEFAKYAFNKSHAACYAVVSYQTAYLKAYYKEELMAATLNSFLGNLDKIPIYIDECRNLGIEVLNPSINESDTKFTVKNNKIRFGLGSIKNVGIAVVQDLVKEREQNGNYKDFIDFCERMSNFSINKKCIESLIKAGAFDEFGKTRKTLMASFEAIIDGINSFSKNKMENQVSMFDLFANEENKPQKYSYVESPEYETKEFLGYEKEMLGIYLSGHPLDKYKNKLKKLTNIDSLNLLEISDELEETGKITSYQDGQTVKIAGIISKIKKKITKNNSLMAFVSLDDLHGSFETIVFESTFNKYEQYLEEDKIILIEGRLSIREDEEPKIVAQSIKEILSPDDENIINIDITSFSEKQKEDLRTLIKFYSKMNNANYKINVIVNGELRPCGKILLNKNNFEKFTTLAGKENIQLKNEI